MKAPTPKPQLYAYYFAPLKCIAAEFGYNLLLHGSMNRDCDFVAVPWVDDPKDEFAMINALSAWLTGHTSDNKNVFLHSVLPGGRHSYVINLNRGTGIEDPQYYIDISVTQLPKT